MREIAILYPVFALAAWTTLVLLLIPLVRVRAAIRQQVAVDDFKFGESPAVPPHVSIPNRNLMNLLELPVLFYVVALLLYITGGASALAVTLAWIYVALRIVHSVIHLTYNHVIHRLAAFASSNVALAGMWVVAAVRVASIG